MILRKYTILTFKENINKCVIIIILGVIVTPKNVLHTIFNEIVVVNSYVDHTKFFLYIMLNIKKKQK